jgi:hypothetical protein
MTRGGTEYSQVRVGVSACSVVWKAVNLMVSRGSNVMTFQCTETKPFYSEGSRLRSESEVPSKYMEEG